MYLILVQML